MEEKENKRVSIIVDEERAERPEGLKREKLKKPVIFCLMGIVFLACLYLIFQPKGESESPDVGLNNAVPEATDKGLQSDKKKAYEKEMLEEKEAEKRNTLMSLSDYWNNADSGNVNAAQLSNSVTGYSRTVPAQNNPLTSYQNAQYTLGSFYRDDDHEKIELRKQVDQLKERLSEKDVPQTPTLNDQLALMEKSYEMASRYLPTGPAIQAMPQSTSSVRKDSSEVKHAGIPDRKEKVAAVQSKRKNVVSALFREQDQESLLSGIGDRNVGFITPGQKVQSDIVRNSIPAMITETKTLSGDGTIKLRLSESAIIGDHRLENGAEMTADAKIQGSRLQLKISSIEVSGNIIPVEILVYSTDGQPGLPVPRSDEINAASEIAANMSQSSGMNISMSRSAGQQIAGDVSRGLIQGVSGFFSKKLRTVKVTVRSGHPVLLYSKK
ncbi:hypothetical protein OK18_00555 [Chryseobacterium gallinarum]|uniref:Conjugative transposon TraM C-terminal domain-containing protein n=1 Tax=Chryseobacterium gallinarum TaxID=1324352 RepID=A0A0G3LY64_CHRGL|nr:conjugative transposon protein TraM [Chryseobacterium gallinarum]AKK71325.1 hypothetical protein OK18_00555 [Chryseobacterium gallinarum]